MGRNKLFVLLTLATNGEPVIIPVDNIAFAIASDGIKEDGSKGDRYSRIFLKQIIINDNDKWVDVRETPEQIAKKTGL